MPYVVTQNTLRLVLEHFYRLSVTQANGFCIRASEIEQKEQTSETITYYYQLLSFSACVCSVNILPGLKRMTAFRQLHSVPSGDNWRKRFIIS